MKKILALAVLFLAACNEPVPGNVMTFDGVGPVKLEMTVEEAAKAVGKPLPHSPENSQPECWYAHEGKSSAQWTVGYMIISGHVRRIDVRSANNETPPIKTELGIGIGASHDDVVKTYGDKIKVELNKYLAQEEGNDLVVDAPKSTARIVFETQKNSSGTKVVTKFRVGLQPEVFYVEGCG